MKTFIVVLETSQDYYNEHQNIENITTFNTLEEANTFVSTYMKDEFGICFLDEFDTFDEFEDEFGCKHIEAVDLEGGVMNIWVNIINMS